MVYITIMASVCWFIVWSLHITTSYASSWSPPDEQMRSEVPLFIHNHHRLPTGYESDVIYEKGYWSYAFYPQLLGAIVSALFMDVASLFSNSASVLLHAGRLASVLFATIAVWFAGKSAYKIFDKSKKNTRLVISCITMIALAFWPQFTFLAAYMNNDIVGLCGVSVLLYGLILAAKDGAGYQNALFVGIGLAVCLLGYNNAYGFVLFGALCYAWLLIKPWADGGLTKRKLQVGALAVIIPMLFAGPFFVRNAILHQGDMLGMHTFSSRQKLWESEHETKLQNPFVTNGRYKSGLKRLILHTDYTGSVNSSFIGMFGMMTIKMAPLWQAAYSIFLFGGVIIACAFYVICFRHKKRRKMSDMDIVVLCTIFACLTTVVLSLYYTLTIDTQPQGRYVIYLLLPLLISAIYGYYRVARLIGINWWIMRCVIPIAALVYMASSVAIVVSLLIPYQNG